MRLCGGEGAVDWPSETRLLSTVGMVPALLELSSDGTSDVRYMLEPLLNRDGVFRGRSDDVLVLTPSPAGCLRGEVGDANPVAVDGRVVELGG